VPVTLDGVPEGVKNEGGVLDFVHREVEIECLPAAIPETLRVDVSPLHTGQNVTLEDVVVPEGVRTLEPGGTVLATVSVSRATVAAAEAEEAEAAEAAAAEEGEEAAAEEKAEAPPPEEGKKP
jgi:large subunit ribosomal protein L25